MSADPRYTIFAARAVFDDRLTAMDVRVLAALGTFTDRQGWCYPSQTTIAKRLGTGRTRVNGSIKALVAAGYVQAVDQWKEGGAQTVSLYRVLMDMSAPEATDAAANAAILPVSNTDTPLSAGETRLEIARADRNETQHIDPPVSGRDTPLSISVTGGVSPADTELTPLELTPKNKRATRLPATWTPRTEEIAFGKEGKLSEAEVMAAADHMRDWAASSPKAIKLDWDRTFRNWLRTTISDAARGRRPVVSAAASFDRAKALKRYFENDYRHPLLTDDDIANASQAQGAKP